VARNDERHPLMSMLSSLGWPVLLGLAACTAFYAAVFQGIFGSSLVQRYFAAHPVSFFATGMFFIGLAALVLKAMNVMGQLAIMGRIGFDEPRGGGVSVDKVGDLLDELEEMSAPARNSYLGRRLQDALEVVERQGNADELHEELRFLADQDAARQHESFALVRIIIWATPMLGFLGTVIGITKALGDLDPTELASSIQTAMEGLLSGLYVAFDTTALALSLSIVLMFIQFLVDRFESQLLTEVESRSEAELVGRFELVGSANDPHLASIQRMGREVVKSTETLVERQTQLWQSAMQKTQEKSSQQSREAVGQVQSALTDALGRSLQQFAERIAQTEEAAADRARERWEQWQTTLSDNARMLHAQQVEMVKLSEMMARVVEATGEVRKLESSLNSNLQSLAGAKNFEDTVMSLSAAIHLLNTRLGAPADESRQIDLRDSKAQGRAA
jgi:biopolymer transport protein ExbB/TolQ